MANKSFTMACAEFFGRLPGESLGDFAKELKELTDEDRAELRPMLSKALGCEIEDKAAAVVA